MRQVRPWLALLWKTKAMKELGLFGCSICRTPQESILQSFVEGVAQTGSTIRTDDWDGYNNLVDGGYRHAVVDSHELKLAHLVTSLLKRWLLGTYQGAVRPSHFAYYLDEFTFRFNRRPSASRGKLFYRLIQQAMMMDPAPVATLKGPISSFIVGTDSFDEDIDHKI